MKLYFSFLLIMLFSFSTFSQIDNEKKSIAIPAVESEKDSSNSTSLLPLKPTKSNNTSVNTINNPLAPMRLSLPKKEFSMFPQENFGNPGELFVKQINKNIEDIKLSPEEVERKNGSLTDQFLGDFKSQAKFVNVVYRDHGFTDGDVIQVLVNDDVINPRVYLTGSYKGFKLNLQKGFNKIDFLALNQGTSGPNTAEFRVVDDSGTLVSHNQWNLATGVKATIIIFKN